MFQQLFYNSV